MTSTTQGNSALGNRAPSGPALAGRRTAAQSGGGTRLPSSRERRPLLAVLAVRRADRANRIDPTDLDPVSIPGFDAALLDLDQPVPVSVRVLGPVGVEASGNIDDERRDLATEIVAYVALHPEGVHPAVLESAIWPRGVTAEVRDAAIRHVQRWLGTGADDEPRPRQDDEGRWRLDLRSVRVDWHVFCKVLDRAHQGGTPSDDLALVLSMLSQPGLRPLPTHRYAWLARSTDVRDMNVTIVEAAGQLSELAAAADDRVFAREAVRTGLLVVPACEELWRQSRTRRRAAAGLPPPGRLRR